MTSTLQTNSRPPLDYKKKTNLPPYFHYIQYNIYASIMSGLEEEETFDTKATDMILEDNIEEVQDRLDQVAEAEEEVRMMRDEMRRKLEVVERCRRRLVALGFKVNLYHILGSTDSPRAWLS